MSFSSQFKHPGADLRDAPFWAWNGLLDEAELRRQIATFAQMGMGGFFMHPRSGMRTRYMGEEFLHAVEECVRHAKSLGLQAWLYDEDRWPSGSASGQLTRDPRFAGRSITLRWTPPEGGDQEPLAAYQVRLDEGGFLLDYARDEGQPMPTGFRRVYCCKELFRRENWFNGERYADLLNPEATRAFLGMTHERYAARLGDEFGAAIPGIFTDEPQLRFHDLPVSPLELDNVRYPFTEALPERCRARFQADFWASFPEVVWDLKGHAPSLARYRYLLLLEEMLDEAYFQPLASWCRAHGLAFTGHLMGEQSLFDQSGYLGECMLHYHAFDLPGVDMLQDHIELTTVLQAASVAHQDGRAEVLSELGGATDWDYPFHAHKAHGDWQAALGVTRRVPHLAWYSMGGEAKRDYPAPIDGHSPWHTKYPLLADHFARLTAALRQGRPLVETAVLHPVESFWLLRGPQATSGMRQAQAEEEFQTLARWLCDGLVPFDYLSEALLPKQQVAVADGALLVGAMRYRTIVVPPVLTLRATTLSWLERFQAAGGRLLFLGEPPRLCDAAPSTRPAALARVRLPFRRLALLEALEAPVSVLDARSGLPLDGLLCQIRQDGTRRILFLCDTRRSGDARAAQVRLKGRWQVELLDTATGAIMPAAAEVAATETRFAFTFGHGGHLLLRLTPAAISPGVPLAARAASTVTRIAGDCLPVTLDEPNCLVLDLPEWRLGDGDWQPREELHRLNTRVREALHLPPVEHRGRQAWAVPPDPEGVPLSLRFTFQSQGVFRQLHLALEEPKAWRITLGDGRAAVPLQETDGFWVDAALATIPLPPLPPGIHTLTLTRDYTASTTLERAFLLGDFAVRLDGTDAAILPSVRHLHWGDWTIQGLPFYGGNLTYHATFFLSEPLAQAALRLPAHTSALAADRPFACQEIDGASFSGALVGVTLNGQPAGDIAFAPFELALGPLKAGRHALDLTLYGHRYNAFGAFHQLGRTPVCPRCWFPDDPLHTREYRLRAMGILAAPIIVQAAGL